MKLSDIGNLTKDDVLGALGLEGRRSTTTWLVESLAIFGVGILVGASVALLVAPKTGRELRGDLRRRFKRGEPEAPREDEASAGA